MTQIFKSEIEKTFSDLFNKHKNLVYKTAYLLLGNRDEAEDALQEVFIKVYRSLSSFDPSKAKFTTWLYHITINNCLNHKRKNHSYLIPLEESLEYRISSSASPEKQLVEEDTIQRAINKLSEKQRTVVILRYYRELSYAEISRILNIPMGTVKSRLNLALRTLRDEMNTTENNTPIPSILRLKEAQNEMSGSS